MSALAYDIVQRLLGSGRNVEAFIERYLDLGPGMKILDVGCGTSRIAAHLPTGVEYVGVDPDEGRLHRARRKYCHRPGFTWATSLSALGPLAMDRCLLIGLLHHLTDSEAGELFADLRKHLKPGAKIITLDGVYHSRQNPLARMLLALDRGRYVRDLEGYAALVSEQTTLQAAELRTDMMRLPYSHAVCTATVPMG